MKHFQVLAFLWLAVAAQAADLRSQVLVMSTNTQPTVRKVYAMLSGTSGTNLLNPTGVFAGRVMPLEQVLIKSNTVVRLVEDIPLTPIDRRYFPPLTPRPAFPNRVYRLVIVDLVSKTTNSVSNGVWRIGRTIDCAQLK